MYNLPQLRAELKAAGVDVPALGVADGEPHTYDASGAAVQLPPAAAAVVAAHMPQPTPRAQALAVLRASTNPETQALLTVLGLTG